jgi:hypothetical protein
MTMRSIDAISSLSEQPEDAAEASEVTERLRWTIELLDALIAELVRDTGGPAPDEWVQPLVFLGIELRALRRVPAHPVRGVNAARGIAMLLEGAIGETEFARNYVPIRETHSRVMTLHVLLLSSCIRLEWLFQRKSERAVDRFVDAPSPTAHAQWRARIEQVLAKIRSTSLAQAATEALEAHQHERRGPVGALAGVIAYPPGDRARPTRR